jgi:multidrug transporter EmrE-like cation transporter
MTLPAFIIVFSSVFLSAVAQLSFKYGVSSVDLEQYSNLFYKAWFLFTSPFVILGLALYGVGTILWLFALKQLDLSLAYPFVGMSFLFVLVFSIIFLQEPFSLNRLAGTVGIIFGIIILSKS